MKQKNPPMFARWMLAHLMPGEANDALAGDLQEELCAGRSAAWCWRQVLGAIAIRYVRELRVHRTTLLFAIPWRILTPLSEIADLRLWTDAFRIPYLVSLVAALWGAVPPTIRTHEAQLAEATSAGLSAQPGALALVSSFDTFTVSRFLALTVGAGLINAMIASFLLTDSSAPQKPALYLGQQPLLTSEPAPSANNSAVAQETLRFFIPPRANIPQFDAITMMFFPEMGYFQTAPQIAIDQFSLIPR